VKPYVPYLIVVGAVVLLAVLVLTLTGGHACAASKTPTAKPTATSKTSNAPAIHIDIDCD
jgi:hypothetical protein